MDYEAVAGHWPWAPFRTSANYPTIRDGPRCTSMCPSVGYYMAAVHRDRDHRESSFPWLTEREMSKSPNGKWRKLFQFTSRQMGNIFFPVSLPVLWEITFNFRQIGICITCLVTIDNLSFFSKGSFRRKTCGLNMSFFFTKASDPPPAGQCCTHRVSLAHLNMY